MNKTPFIAWSCAQEYNVASPDFQISCEKHLQSAQKRIEEIIGPSAIEGIILYDHLQRGMAVASLLTKENKTLPTSCHGATCDSHFDEDDLANETNTYSFQARLHAGSRGMLIRAGENGARPFILLDQREAAQLHPMGRSKSPDQSLAAFGLLAHEMAHARDYANGRPGLASIDEIFETVAPGRAEAIHVISDMALAEYVATRAECRAQVAIEGACSKSLTSRIDQMARHSLKLPDLDLKEEADGEAFQQHQMDLSSIGYSIGTLAAYRNARAPIRNEDPSLRSKTTDQMLLQAMPKTSTLEGILEKVSPALEAASSAPDTKSRKALASILEVAITAAQKAPQERPRRNARDTSIDAWFDGI